MQDTLFTLILAKRPGVARGKRIKIIFFKLKKKIEFDSLKHPPVTPECQQKFLPNRSSRLASYTQHIYTNVLFFT